MTKVMTLGRGSEAFPIELRRHKRARHITLAIHPGGTVRVTRPLWVNQASAMDFVRENIAWIKKKLAGLTNIDSNITTRDRAHYLEHKESARQLVEERLVYWNTFYFFEYQRISIRNTRTRWGSCSSKGNLNFNYKIKFLPQKLQDYLIVHELCHLKEMNHSSRFWALVEKTIPRYKTLRKQLARFDF